MTRLNFDFCVVRRVHVEEARLTPPVRNLRRKFKTIDAASPIELTVSTNIEAEVDELYPLYLQIYERSSMHFEKADARVCRATRPLDGPTRYGIFVWRQKRPSGRLSASAPSTATPSATSTSASTINRASPPASTTTTFRDIVKLGAGPGP